MAPSRLKQLLLKLFRRRDGRPNLPPGPCPLPILGNIFKIARARPHRSLQSLADRYGPLMLIRMGSSRVVVGSSPEVARAILTLHDAAFASRPATTAGKLLNYNRTDIGWAPYGPYWLQGRAICARHLLPAPRLESFARSRLEEARALVRGIREAGDTDLRGSLFRTTLNMQCRLVFGTVRQDEEFVNMIADFMKLDGVTDIGEMIPWLEFLDLQGNVKKMKEVSRMCEEFWEGVVRSREEIRARRRASGEPDAEDCLVDVLLRLSEDTTLEVKLGRDGVKAFAQDIIAGGTGSCSATVEWALSELLRHPHMLDKAAEELDRVVGNARWVEEGDVPNLPYLRSIVKEAMRLHPIAPILIPHLSREARNIAGYDIPAGTQIFINVYAIMRDPKVWESPLEFQPERFLERQTDVTGEDHGLLPFGTGSRMCPGHVLGLRMVQLLLASLLQGFRWRLPEGVRAEDLNMDDEFGLATVRKVPLKAIAEPRLPEKMYSA